MITIKEIAALAQVSPSTVSNVLHGRSHKMKADTLKRVKQIIKEYNYISNMSGRTLGRYGSKIIAVVMNYVRRDELNAMQDPFLGGILGALEHEIRTAGFFLMLYISANVGESLRMAASWNAEGLIAISYNQESCRHFIEGARKIGIPIVFIDAYFDGEKSFFNVGLQDRQGGFMMTEYLAGLGHTSIAFLGDREIPIGVDYERFLGYQGALEKYGFPFSEENYVCIRYRPAERRERLKQFIKKRLRIYSALFFTSDYLAADSINLFHDEGIRVPEDVSVCGFDDNIFAVAVRPKLTTVKQDIGQKAFYAVKQIRALIRKENLKENRISLPVSLVIRDSVRDLKSKSLLHKGPRHAP
ncbi:MAG: LacI family transcriptional regulator [Treponema sp.]|jgi:LacI family transcriptional regulator|nr:LacI family transcriptional regulator [Treponema sp.]